MFRNIIAGITVGIANVIPGVSGGTMMLLMGVFDKVLAAVASLVHYRDASFKGHVGFLLQLGLGVAVGLIGFANVLEFLFRIAPAVTLYWFCGLVVFSIPVFLKREMQGAKINYPALLCGFILVMVLNYLSGDVDAALSPALPSLTLPFLFLLLLIGFVGGFTMFLPGVSGSLVLLILGYYHLFKTYLANVLTFKAEIIIPLGMMAIGVIFGIIVSAKLIALALKKNKAMTLSFLLGLIAASTLVLIGQSMAYDYKIMTVVLSVCSFFFGGLLIAIIDRCVA